MVCGAGSVTRLSIRLSVPLFDRSHDVPCGGSAGEFCAGVCYNEWMKARLTSKALVLGDTGAHQQWRCRMGHSTALSSKCEQCHVYS